MAMTTHTISQIHINKTNLHDTHVHEVSFDDNELQQGQLLLKVDRFGFSANNITYAALGDKMGYWGFFPAGEHSDKYGIMPVWGFAEVVASKHDEVPVGKRVYGYLPFASHLVVDVSNLKDTGFHDSNKARVSINKVYDQYLFVDSDPAYIAQREVWQMNFRPLFMTSFVLGLHVNDNAAQGQVLLSSAASKTALGTAAYLTSLKDRNFKVIGLTSEGNKTFVENTGCYDHVLSYQALPELDANTSAWLLDFAANGDVHDTLHGHLADNLQKISLIGATDWSASNKPSMTQANSSVFFAPAEVQQRIKEMGQGGFMLSYAGAWKNFATVSAKLMQEQSFEGTEALISLYQSALDNRLVTSTLVDASF